MDKQEFQRLISEGLVRQRLLHGITVARAAEIAGVPAKVYGAAERNKTPLAQEALDRLCQKWRVSLFHLCEPRHIPQAAFLTCKPENKSEAMRRDEDVWEVYKWARDYAFIERALGRSVEPEQRLFVPRAPVEAARFVRSTFWELGGFTPESMPSVLARHGIKVCVKPFRAAKVEGFSFHDKDCGWVIAVNGNPTMPAEAQARTAAHEFGHIVLGTHDRYCKHGTPEETAADAFASELLLPEISFKEFWDYNAHRAPYDRIIAVKHAFKVPYGMVVYRVAAMAPEQERKQLHRFYAGLLKQNTGHGTSGRAFEPEPSALRFPFVPDLFRTLAVEAYEKNVISCSKLAELLQCTVSDVRDMLETRRNDCHV